MWVKTILLLLMIPAGTLTTQETAYLDLRGIQPRTDLRYPESKSEPVCNGLICTFEGPAISSSLSCGAGRQDEPRALKITVLSLDRTSYAESDDAEIEIRIENVGTVAMTLPWNPHLADLQSSDITARLNYLSSTLYLTLAKAGTKDERLLRIAELYGTSDVPNSLVTIAPGQWLHLRAMVPLDIPPEQRQQTDWEANVTLGLREVEFIPNTKEFGYGENIKNEYPRVSSGPDVPLQIFEPNSPQPEAGSHKE